MADQKPPDRKEAKVEARIPMELKEKVEKKATERGWSLASVIRALLEAWVDEDMVDPKDVGRANQRAKRTKKKPKE